MGHFKMYSSGFWMSICFEYQLTKKHEPYIVFSDIIMEAYRYMYVGVKIKLMFFVSYFVIFMLNRLIIGIMIKLRIL